MWNAQSRQIWHLTIAAALGAALKCSPFAVHRAYLRFPGRVLGPKEAPPAYMLAFIADQLRIDSNDFGDYAQRGETRREHLGELQAYLGVQPFGRQDYRTMARIAFNESIGTDRGEAIAGAMVAHLGQNSILLPSAAVLEKIALVERARARKQAYKELTRILHRPLEKAWLIPDKMLGAR
jgi:hypothetical protein